VVRGGRLETVLALVAIVAAAFNLRIGVTEVGPLIDRIRTDTGMSATLAGALGSIPFACMGVFAPLGLRLLRRRTARGLIAACLLVIAAGTIARALAPTAWLVVAATLPVGVGIAVAGVVLPGLIKTHFPRRTGAAMGVYVAVLSIGASVTALTMVPLTQALEGWRWAFGVSAIPALACLPLWLLMPVRRAGRQATAAGPEPPSARASGGARADPRLILLLAAVFGLQSVCFAAVTNWVAALYHHHGWSLSAASLTTALVSILVIPSALVIPALSDRGDRRRWVLGSAIVMTVGMFGFAFAPTSAPWLWIVSFAVGNGALFPLALTLPQDLADDERTRSLLTTWTLGLGYTLGATGPLIVGALLDLTGDFVVPMAGLGAVGLFSGVFALAPSLERPGQGPGLVRSALSGDLRARPELPEGEQSPGVLAVDRRGD
jgi:MFS transporter, CP family, cyanate transporter